METHKRTLWSFTLCRIHTEGPALAQGIGTEGKGTPKEASRTGFLGRPALEGIPRTALHMVSASVEWMPSRRDESLRADDISRTATLCLLAPGSTEAQHEGAQGSHGRTRADTVLRWESE